MRAAAAGLNGSMASYTPINRRGYTPREAMLQSFAVVACWSVGTGWCAGEDGRGRRARNAGSGALG